MGPLVAVTFVGTVIEWRGPAPFLFVPMPDEHIGELHHAARQASYGWGMVPVEAAIGPAVFKTSLFPRNGGYLLPVKVAVQRAAGISVGDRVRVSITVAG